MSGRLWLVVGARPNFVKAAPVDRALRRRGAFEVHLVHTGQHYDHRLSDSFFEDLELPRPDLHLGVGSGTHARQTAQVMMGIEGPLQDDRPSGVVVFGDVNSTVAASLAAAKLGIPVAHVESGLRSFDRRMPEEINRCVTDRLADLLFVTEESGRRNLLDEGVEPSRIFFVGNTMVDSLDHHLERARDRGAAALARMGVEGAYAVATLHRPSNVDGDRLGELLRALGTISEALPVIFPVHPRTRQRIAAGGLEPASGLLLVEPLAYLDFLGILAGARLVATDSGGIQEETTALGVPCLTLRENTERPVTISQGTNRLIGTGIADVVSAARELLAESGRPEVGRPELWDGRAGERIAAILEEELGEGGRPPSTP